MPATGSSFRLNAPGDLDLPHTVCSYGYFMLAPNRWSPANATLHRALRVEGRIVSLRVDQPGGRGAPLRIRSDRKLGRDQQQRARVAVGRMLRLDESAEDFARWYEMRPEARFLGFARLFRSPTLFEDVVKTITGCNVSWSMTIRMNQLLCDEVGGGAFPEPAALARLDPAELKARCKVGYRAERIVRLAHDVEAGTLDLDAFEADDMATDELFHRLKAIHGIGDYAAGNLCQLLGRYDRLAIDSETYRHFREVHGVKTPKDAAGLRWLHRRIERHYARFAPFQFLAYWFELWRAYERKVGEATAWPSDVPPTLSR